MAHDLRNCQSIPEIAQATDRLRWFPSAVDSPSLALRQAVTRINEVSQDAAAAIRALGNPGWRINLRKAQVSLEALQEILGKMDHRASAPLVPLVESWQDKVVQALEGVSRDVGPIVIENFYIAGNPIPADKEQVFVGREDLVAKIQENLAAIQKPTLVLHGQRRTGKTSLLLHLPGRLPADYVPVYVDLQKTVSVDGLNRFLYNLAREAVSQADKVRRIALPPVELEDFNYRGPHAFYDWLEQTRQRLENRLLLFALDEFEKIEEAIEKGQMEEAVLDVLRHVIQHHSPWLVLLLAGMRTLEEMSRNWHSYFISVRPLRVSYLESKAARELILLPTRHYPIHYEERAIKTILTATHAQPYLIQAVCFELIQHLNSARRRAAGPFEQVTTTDTQKAIQEAVRSAHPYFSDLWNTSKDSERLVLAEMAYQLGEWVRIDDLHKGNDLALEEVHRIVDGLQRREMLERNTRQCRFSVLMMRQWIREEHSLEALRLTSQSPPGDSRKRGQG
jgi:AAA+ ATPase superfamily predicted ATPase